MAEELSKARFENITAMIRYHDNKMQVAFNRFITLSIGIVGGVFWLLSQKNIDKLGKEAVISILPILFWFLGVSSLLIIYSNWKSWYNFRQAESEMLKGEVPPPKCPKACKEQLIMAAIIMTVCVSFTCCNPFKIYL